MLRVVTPAGHWLVSGDDGATNMVTEGEPYSVWIAPGRRLVVAMLPTAAPTGPYVSEVAGEMAVLDLSGPRWPDILAMASSIDPALLAHRRCTQGQFAGVQALMYRHGDALRLHVAQADAALVLQWLRRAKDQLERDVP